jgi:hypothetical protein
MKTSLTPRQIFLTRLWAFLNYRTTIRLTWLELLTASLVGLMLVWVGLRDGTALAFVGPFAIYLLLLGFYRELRIPVGWIRTLDLWLFKPVEVKPEPNKKYYAIALIAGAILATQLLWRLDLRLALLLAVLLLIAAVLLWAIDERETMGGKLNLHTVAGRIPIRQILEDGTIANRDGTLAKVAIITLARTGYKPALKAVDAAETLTKFLAYLAQHEEGGQPIKLFWLTDYHLGQLDLGEGKYAQPEYIQELRVLAESGARKARVIITGIVYPAAVEERIREWLAPLDLGLSPLGAYAVESLLRMLFGGDSFLGQIQEAMLYNGGGLPRAADRGFLPERLGFGAQLQTERNLLTVLRVDTPFVEAREALMRALQSVDGMLTVTLAPLPRDKSATEIRGRLLAARVPGLGRMREVAYLRDWLNKLEDRRSLEYLFDTQTYWVTWGRDEREVQVNQTLAESYLTALSLTPLAHRGLEDSLTGWLPILELPRATDRFTRVMDWLTVPYRVPVQRLLTTEAISTLAREEGSDIHLAEARGRILLGRSITPGKEGLRYADFRSDTGPVLFVSDQGGGKTSTMIVWFILRLHLLNYKVIAVNLKYSTRMQAAVEKVDGIVLHPEEKLSHFEDTTRAALFSERTVLYQPVKGTRPYAIADDPCLRAFMKILYEEWLPHRSSPAALVIDEIHRLMPKDRPLSDAASESATYVAEAFKDWAERKLVIAASTQTLRDLLGSNLGVALQKFRTVAYFQVGPEDREMLLEKGYEAALLDLIIGARRRPRGYCVLVMPDGFYTTIKILVTPDEREIIQRLDVEETADVTPQLAFK